MRCFIPHMPPADPTRAHDHLINFDLNFLFRRISGVIRVMLSIEEYKAEIVSFLEVSQRIDKEWTRLLNTNGTCNEDWAIRKKQQTLTESTGLIHFDYHVVYNEAFSVPQLLFSAFRTDGSLVPVSQLHDSIPHYILPIDSLSQSSRQEALWETLSQIEHPFLHCPVYTLHPCQTASLIATIRSFTKKWFVPWLSAIGPAVGLHLSTQYCLNTTDH